MEQKENKILIHCCCAICSAYSILSLKNQGYEIVPISELILRENFHMDVTGQQISD